LYHLFQRNQLFQKNSSKYFCTIKFSVPEVKILILSCYFIIFGIITLVNISITNRDSNAVLHRMLKYFDCQARGSSANNTCSEEYDELDSYSKSELNGITYFLLCFIPWSNLLFAIKFSHIKTAIQKVLTAFHHQ